MGAPGLGEGTVGDRLGGGDGQRLSVDERPGAAGGGGGVDGQAVGAGDAQGAGGPVERREAATGSIRAGGEPAAVEVDAGGGAVGDDGERAQDVELADAADVQRADARRRRG